MSKHLLLVRRVSHSISKFWYPVRQPRPKYCADRKQSLLVSTHPFVNSFCLPVILVLEIKKLLSNCRGIWLYCVLKWEKGSTSFCNFYGIVMLNGKEFFMIWWVTPLLKIGKLWTKIVLKFCNSKLFVAEEKTRENAWTQNLKFMWICKMYTSHIQGVGWSQEVNS